MRAPTDFSSMKLAELTAEWNTMVVKAKELQIPGTWVEIKLFKDKSTALARCTKLSTALAQAAAGSERESQLLHIMQTDACPRAKGNGKVPHDLETIPDWLRLTAEERACGRAQAEAQPVQAETKPAPKPATSTNKENKRGGFPLEAVMTVLIDHNPKRPGTAGYERFAKYRTGMTVREAYAAGVWAADLRWDKKKGFIEIKEKK